MSMMQWGHSESILKRGWVLWTWLTVMGLLRYAGVIEWPWYVIVTAPLSLIGFMVLIQEWYVIPAEQKRIHGDIDGL